MGYKSTGEDYEYAHSIKILIFDFRRNLRWRILPNFPRALISLKFSEIAMDIHMSGQKKADSQPHQEKASHNFRSSSL